MLCFAGWWHCSHVWTFPKQMILLVIFREFDHYLSLHAQASQLLLWHLTRWWQFIIVIICYSLISSSFRVIPELYLVWFNARRDWRPGNPAWFSENWDHWHADEGNFRFSVTPHLLLHLKLKLCFTSSFMQLLWKLMFSQTLKPRLTFDRDSDPWIM